MTGMGPRERLSLRYVLTALFFLLVAGLEGMLMESRLAGFLADYYVPEKWYSMLTAHPFVGIYGWAYMAVMGAFYYLVPHVLKRDLYSERVARISYWMMVGGVLVVWGSGFFLDFGALYTLYWPLPVISFPASSLLPFSVGMLLIFISVLAFFFNMFATIFLVKGSENEGVGTGRKAGYVATQLLTTAFNIDKAKAVARGAKDYTARVYNYPVFVVGVFRGCVDTTINALIMAGTAGLLAAYSISSLLGVALSPSLVDPLWYKNVFWWGLDMIADGNVLIFTAAVWYFLTPLLTGRKLYAEQVVRTVILADLVVSLGVWGHHMMADTPQPTLLLIEGQIVTWGELVTMGLTMFAVLMTIWKARPVKYSAPLIAVLLSMAGYAIGGSGGIIQANYALNRYIHNTMWVIGIHAHIQLLAGLTLTIFAVIFALAPILTGKGMGSKLASAQLLLWFSGAMVMGVDWGLAGVAGMLRRWIYLDGAYAGYMDVGLIGGVLMGTAFLLFLYNFLKTYGIGAIVAAFRGEKAQTGLNVVSSA